MLLASGLLIPVPHLRHHAEVADDRLAPHEACRRIGAKLYSEGLPNPHFDLALYVLPLVEIIAGHLDVAGR